MYLKKKKTPLRLVNISLSVVLGFNVKREKLKRQKLRRPKKKTWTSSQSKKKKTRHKTHESWPVTNFCEKLWWCSHRLDAFSQECQKLIWVLYARHHCPSLSFGHILILVGNIVILTGNWLEVCLCGPSTACSRNLRYRLLWRLTILQDNFSRRVFGKNWFYILENLE